MDIDKIEKPTKKRIKDFILEHDEEVFDSDEVTERIGIDITSTAVRYHCERLWEDGEIGKIKYGNKFLYGAPKAIKVLKDKLGYE